LASSALVTCFSDRTPGDVGLNDFKAIDITP